MVSLSKKIFLISATLAIFLPLGTFAATQDYLVVSADYTYVGGNFSNVVGQVQTIDTKQVHIYKSGTYKMELYDRTGVIANNFFEIPKAGIMEVIGTDVSTGAQSYSTAPTTKEIIQSVLPLTKSLRPEDASIRILKGKTVLFDKKLSDISISIISEGINKLILPPPPPAPPITPAPAIKPLVSATDWMTTTTPISNGTQTSPVATKVQPKDVKGIILVSLGVIGLILVVLSWFRTGKVDRVSMGVFAGWRPGFQKWRC